MDKEELEELIRETFRGVVLGAGVSLRQSRVQDNWGRDEHGKEMSTTNWQQEVTHDWTRIPPQDLSEDWSFSHLVEEGFRYYLPAFMLCLLNGLASSTTNHSLLFVLCPEEGRLWDYDMLRYSLLNEQQRYAVAHFLLWLPDTAYLDEYERADAAQALESYWKQYL